MKQKRIRIDVQDKDGAKYDFKIEGNVTKEKVLKIFELMDLINIEEEPGTKPRLCRRENLECCRKLLPHRQIYLFRGA